MSQTFSGQICVRDADDLETWLELAPAVHAWISRLLGKDPGDTQALDTFWMDWREATEPPLSTELIIAGRDKATRHIAHHRQGLPDGLHAVLAVRTAVFNDTYDSFCEQQSLLVA